jgi:hypothetical protein
MRTHFTFVADCAPKKVRFAVDLHVHLTQLAPGADLRGTDKENRMYFGTARRMISGPVLKYLSGEHLVIEEG